MSNYHIKMRFLRIDNWTGLLSPYICGWPNFMHANYNDGRGFVYGHQLLPDSVADWREVPATEFGNFDTAPFRARFTWTHDYAVRQGYQHGFPNFQQANVGGTLHYGVYLIVPGTAVWRDVPAVELGLGSGDPETRTMDEWFAGAALYAFNQGFAAGMPNGHRANYGQGFVCGVFLFPHGTTEWVDIPGTQLGLLSGLTPTGGTNPRPPDPVSDSRPPPTSGTIVVTLGRPPEAIYDSGYRAGTTPNPTVWQGKAARITGVRNLHHEDINLSHTDSSGARVWRVSVPKRSAGLISSAGPTVQNFNSMLVEGDWSAETTWTGIPPITIAFEFDWSV